LKWGGAKIPAAAIQQPRQIFFNCAFIRASSAPIASIYFPLSGFPVSAFAAGLAGAARLAVAGLLADMGLSRHGSKPSTSGAAVQSGVWATAGNDKAQTATSTAKSLISTSSMTYETNHEVSALPRRLRLFS
jgi:hypothetical protein